MARRSGFWKGGRNFLDELDRIAATTVYNGPKAVAEKVVRDLQEIGPGWTGRFSNSWQIETPTRTRKGTGAEGEPQPLYTPSISGREAARSFATRNKVLFTISNFSPYAGQATDLEPFQPAKLKDETPIKPIEGIGKRPPGGKRGELTGPGGNRRTAPLNWFTKYNRAGNLDKTVQIIMDQAMRGLK